MKSLRYRDFSEIDFIRALSKEQRLPLQAQTTSLHDLAHDLRADRVRAVWEEYTPTTGLPTFLIANQETLKSTLERLVALPGGISPLTSIVRAWDIDDLGLMGTSLDVITPVLASAFVGLIHGELLRAIGKEADFRHMGLDIVRRTLSFTCAQATAKGYPEIALATVASRWLEVSQLTGNSRVTSTALATANLCAFASTACNVKESPPSTYELAQLIQSWLNINSTRSQRALLPSDSLLEQVAFFASDSSREARAEAIDAALSKIVERRGSALELGFLISLIDPGSFEFFDYASRYDNGDGSVALAYSMFAGILGGPATLGKFRGFGMNVYVNGLGQNSTFDNDIALAEIRILNDALRRSSIDFRTRSPSTIDVELMPGVSGSFFNGMRRKQGHVPQQAIQLEVESLRKRLAYVKQALDAAYAVLDDADTRLEKKAHGNRRQKEIM
ncbi:hypothetical protein [Achromobacter xylosoxidans]|uniref:hypothetical protein n=1 Tax=Alcaligenes xylosoxydans xylosoxydans TaxID=85698 RepID=UPI0006C439D1|nr:hypothetical protein [Achromobacter xylosoxidans]CUJ53590.1 Uncharacterised protein [Achromobacter xylosoxidans]